MIGWLILMLRKLLSRSPTTVRILGGPFKGAKMFLNPANSKRKIFGLYEHVLNNWITKTIVGKNFVFDVGGNTGYDTYGFAHLLLKQKTPAPLVIAFEPESFPELQKPKIWKEYTDCRIEIVKKYVGKSSDGMVISLDDAYETYIYDKNSKGIIKIDIEGAEVEALAGAEELLNNPAHEWLIEIHGKELIPDVARFFVEHKRPFLIKELEPLPIIGRESRPVHTTWLVTI